MEKTFKFESKCDGLVLDGICIEPEGEIKGIFQIAHGMAENKERYLGFMKVLADNGYVAVITDHRGHGKSIKSSDDLGYFYDTSCTYIYRDIHDVGMYFKHKYKVPYTLFGHSMGSLVVREVLKYFGKDLDQLIVCGSPSQNPAASLAIQMVKVQSKLKGDHYRSAFINNLALGGYQKKFDEPVENTWLSVNRENVEAYNANPLCGFMFTLNGFLNLFNLMKDCYDKKDWKLTNLDLPILFIAGEFDPCIESKEKWLAAQEFLSNVGYTNIKNHLYPNMRHEILLEDNHVDVYNDVLAFLKGA